MSEVKRIAITDKDGNNILLSVVQSLDDPLKRGIVILNPDGSMITGGGGSPIGVPINFVDLYDLYNTGNLVDGTFYAIMDYQTIHLIPLTTDINTGPNEVIIVQATGPDQLTTHGFSYNFIDDFIEYDITNVLCEDGSTDRPGLITYRKNMTTNTEAYYDWRVRLFRRYGIDLVGYAWDNTATYTLGALVVKGSILFVCVGSTPGVGVPPSTDPKNRTQINDMNINKTPFPDGQYIGGIAINLDYYNYEDYITFNGHYRDVHINISSSDIVFFDEAKNVNIGMQCNNVTYMGVVDNLKMGDNASRMRGQNITHFESEQSQANIVTLLNCRLGFIGFKSQYCIFGNDSNRAKMLGNNIYCIDTGKSDKNVIGIGCRTCIHGFKTTNNTIGDNGNTVIIFTDSNNNKIGDNCFDILLLQQCLWNTIGSDCNTVLLGKDCRYNTIGNNGIDITIMDSCVLQNIGIFCSTIYILGQCNQNSIGDASDTVYFSSQVQQARIGKNCYNINLSDYAQDIIIEDRCKYIYIYEQCITVKVGLYSNIVSIGMYSNTISCGVNSMNINVLMGCTAIMIGGNTSNIIIKDSAGMVTILENGYNVIVGPSSYGLRLGYSCGALIFQTGTINDWLGDGIENIDFENDNVQQIIPDSGNIPDGGVYTLTFNGFTTVFMTFYYDQNAIKTELEALSSIGVGNVEVTGDITTQIQVTFVGALASSAQPAITINSSLLTIGGIPLSIPPTVNILAAGGAAATHMIAPYYCQLYYNAGNVQRLQYLDSSDNINIVDPSS